MRTFSLPPLESWKWDNLTDSAERLDVAVAVYSEEKSCIVGRTADPRLNPGAVRASESSTNHRRYLDGIKHL